ncbi:DUF58 domain-containing protein [Alcanivorax quisquiliarum]|uniref:DUF58 domain-containing protein n=1 Tax=Alcanivorax quisquiliarum TaxID=2933565 RepID=A0ABT0E9I1_9GAMM|nr:DUF58 domain-containing protein [Alcanivorax quisquiliarum]MCK0538304.1 DUF58 domain-containing protein [Alcanivorax quisquiliarum]
MMIPARRLLLAIAGWAGLALLAALAPLADASLRAPLTSLWLAAGLLLAILAGCDAWRSRRELAPAATRTLPSALAAGRPGIIEINLDRSDWRPGTLLLDQHPGDDDQTGMPLALMPPSTPRPGQTTRLQYVYRPARRGVAQFGDIHLWCPSPAGLWLRRHVIAASTEVPVYPDFSFLSTEPLAAAPQTRHRPGRHLRRTGGDGQEFHQLRDYRAGDTLRQIDWPATVRRGNLISREYRDEQQRHLILLLDGSRRLAPLIGTRSVFDHALDAALLMASTALDQGDRPGLLLCAAEQPLWVPPLASRTALSRLLGQVYPLQPADTNSDYSTAASELMRRWRRQALVVLITRLQPDDEDDLLLAVRLLAGRYRLMIGDMQLPAQQALARAPVNVAEHALQIATDAGYQQARQALYGRLRHAGVQVIDGTPDTLPTRLNQLYVSLRQAGRL